MVVSGCETALRGSGELVGMGRFSPLLPSFGELSTAPSALRNQPLTRDWTGDESGVGDKEGNDVRLLSSAAGDGVRPREALELLLIGLTRIVLLFLLTDAVDCCDDVRTRSVAPGVSEAAISVVFVCWRAHARHGRGFRLGGGVDGVVVGTRRGGAGRE